MARPGSKTNKTASNSGGIFGWWKQSREEKKQDALERYARGISQETAKNEANMIEALGSIDFLHSNLPEEALEQRAKPEQPYGDLEYTVLSIMKILKMNPLDVTINVVELDKRLMILINMLKEAVEQGDREAAFAAKAGLVRGVNDIRRRLPQQKTDLAELFVKQHAQYLDGWITLISSAKVVDGTKRNLLDKQAKYEVSKGENKARQDEMTQLFNENSPMGKAYVDILSNDLPEQRMKWTPEQRQVHRMLIEQAMQTVTLNLRSFELDQSQLELSSMENNLNVLFTALSDVPVVEDPNLLNQQKDVIEQMMKDLAETDVRISESLKHMDELAGQLEQLTYSDGSVRSMEIARERANENIKTIQQDQEIRSGSLTERRKKLMEQRGILSEEELAQRKQSIERQQAEQMQQALYVEQ